MSAQLKYATLKGKGTDAQTKEFDRIGSVFKDPVTTVRKKPEQSRKWSLHR